MAVVRVNNPYALESEYYAAVTRIDPFQDAAPCFQLNAMGEQWEGWGLKSRWEPAYRNDDERQYVQEHNRIWKRNHKEA